MRTSHYLLLLTAAAGFATGFSSRGRHRGGPAPDPAPSPGEKKQASIPILSLGPLPVSTDTRESLLQLPQADLYPRLALWLLDASEEEIAAFWSVWHPKSKGKPEIELLILSQWAKRNPKAMLEAAKQAGRESLAWTAWAASDPQPALAAVGGPGPMHSAVMQSMASMDPAWALKMLEADPSLEEVFVYLVDIAKAAHPDDPRAQIEFLNRFDKHQAADRFKAWAKDDPHKALGWLNERASPQLRDAFLQVIQRTNPDLLGELAEESQPGKMKQMLEAAAFAHLAILDPEKALETARQIEVPRLAAERLTQLGRTLIAENPQRALEVLAEVFGRFPDAHGRLSMIRFPDGAQYQQTGISGLREFLNELVAKDPRQTLEATLGIEKSLPEPSEQAKQFNRDPGSVTVAQAWAERDQAAFLEWAKAQGDPAAHETTARVMAGRLAQKMEFAASIEWSMQIKDDRSKTSAIYQAFPGWAGADPVAAGKWLDTSGLDSSMKDSLRATIPGKP